MNVFSAPAPTRILERLNAADVSRPLNDTEVGPKWEREHEFAVTVSHWHSDSTHGTTNWC